jgi:excisionase family DNA binding protein
MSVQLFKLKEVCQMFHVSKPTLYKWMREGKLKTVKIDGLRFVNEEDLKELVKGK